MVQTKTPKKGSLRDRIEKQVIQSPSQTDYVYDEVEEFVPGLIHEISLGLPLPKTDLKTKDSAKQAVAELTKKLEELHSYQNRVHQLRDLLLEKKHALVSSQNSAELPDQKRELLKK